MLSSRDPVQDWVFDHFFTPLGGWNTEFGPVTLNVQVSCCFISTRRLFPNNHGSGTWTCWGPNSSSKHSCKITKLEATTQNARNNFASPGQLISYPFSRDIEMPNADDFYQWYEYVSLNLFSILFQVKKHFQFCLRTGHCQYFCFKVFCCLETLRWCWKILSLRLLVVMVFGRFFFYWSYWKCVSRKAVHILQSERWKRGVNSRRNMKKSSVWDLPQQASTWYDRFDMLLGHWGACCSWCVKDSFNTLPCFMYNFKFQCAFPLKVEVSTLFSFNVISQARLSGGNIIRYSLCRYSKQPFQVWITNR